MAQFSITKNGMDVANTDDTGGMPGMGGAGM